jgi:hypothetical protein
MDSGALSDIHEIKSIVHFSLQHNSNIIYNL